MRDIQTDERQTDDNDAKDAVQHGCSASVMCMSISNKLHQQYQNTGEK